MSRWVLRDAAVTERVLLAVFRGIVVDDDFVAGLLGFEDSTEWCSWGLGGGNAAVAARTGSGGGCQVAAHGLGVTGVARRVGVGIHGRL